VEREIINYYNVSSSYGKYWDLAVAVEKAFFFGKERKGERERGRERGRECGTFFTFAEHFSLLRVEVV
jgi:hypothetical protein